MTTTTTTATTKDLHNSCLIFIIYRYRGRYIAGSVVGGGVQRGGGDVQKEEDGVDLKYE